MRTRPGSWTVTLALLLVAGLVSGCSLGEQDQAGTELEVAAVQRGSLTSSITAVGTVRAGTEVIMSFDAPGQVSTMLVQEGERVEKGQLLAQLDQADLALQVSSAKAVLAAAQAQLDALREGPRPEEISAAEGQVAAAQAALDQAMAQRDQLLSGATDAEISAAQAAVKSAQANYDRVKAGPSPNRWPRPRQCWTSPRPRYSRPRRLTIGLRAAWMWACCPKPWPCKTPRLKRNEFRPTMMPC